jgi:transcriptional regulator of arginine metabolism
MRILFFLCAYLCNHEKAMPTLGLSRAQRQDAIRELLQSAPAATQRSLVQALRARGFDATQSSVSRDLRELGALKTNDGYVLGEGSAAGHHELTQVASMLRGLHPAGPHLLVIKTAIGAAQRVALALDRCDWPEIVGNIGGDDTVFAATASAADQRNLLARIERATARAYS